MDYEYLIIDQKGTNVLLTINRPKALNALNRQIFSELKYFFTEGYKALDEFVGVILTGAGDKAFVAGADIKEFTGLDAAEAEYLSHRGQNIFFLIERFHKPVIAAVNGFSLGGGCELAMSCHMRIASENARFGQPEVNLGIIPGYGGSQRLVQYIGKGKAMELLLTADMINAQQAQQLGLVNDVVAAEDLISSCESVLNKIGTKGPVAVAKIIECVNAYFEKEVDGFAKEYRSFGVTANTEDFLEGARAFIEKRKPDFKGK